MFELHNLYQTIQFQINQFKNVKIELSNSSHKSNSKLGDLKLLYKLSNQNISIYFWIIQVINDLLK